MRVRMQTVLARPVPIGSLVAVRIAFGVPMLAAVGRYFAHGWIDALYVAPEVFFPYPGLEWIRPWPGAGMHVHFLVLGAAAACITLGLWFRAAMATFLVGFTWIHLIDRTTYLNHYHLVSLIALLLVCLPAHRAASLDAWRNPRLRAATTPAWTIGILRVQLAVVYLFGGIAKLNADWLWHAQPLRMWLGANVDLPLLGPWLETSWVAFAMSWAGAAFDLSIPFLLSWKRTRPWAYLAVIGFHAATAALFPIGMFPWIMIAATLVFFEGEELARFARKAGSFVRSVRSFGVRGRAAPSPGHGATPSLADRVAAVTGTGEGGPMPRSAFAFAPRLLLAGFFAFQVLVPLRHLAYPGDVLWTEEGYRFSWRVMLVEKSGSVTYRVTDPDSGRSWEVSPDDHLTMQQARQMAFQPDMILDFAHYLRDRLAAGGVPQAEVRADAYVSVNGRPGARLVDPTVDLARVPRGFAPKEWILPPPGVRADRAVDSEAKLSRRTPL